jgi:hypothetical protein
MMVSDTFTHSSELSNSDFFSDAPESSDDGLSAAETAGIVVGSVVATGGAVVGSFLIARKVMGRKGPVTNETDISGLSEGEDGDDSEDSDGDVESENEASTPDNHEINEDKRIDQGAFEKESAVSSSVAGGVSGVGGAGVASGGALVTRSSVSVEVEGPEVLGDELEFDEDDDDEIESDDLNLGHNLEAQKMNQERETCEGVYERESVMISSVAGSAQAASGCAVLTESSIAVEVEAGEGESESEEDEDENGNSEKKPTV